MKMITLFAEWTYFEIGHFSRCAESQLVNREHIEILDFSQIPYLGFGI